MPSHLFTEDSSQQPSNFETGALAQFCIPPPMYPSIDHLGDSHAKDRSFDATQTSHKVSFLDATGRPATLFCAARRKLQEDRVVGGIYGDELRKDGMFLSGSVVEREPEPIHSQESEKDFSCEHSSLRNVERFEIKVGDKEDKPTEYGKDASNDYKVVNGGVSGDSSKDRSLTPHPQTDDRREGSSQVESGSAGEVSSGRKRRSRWEPRENDADTQDSAQSGRKKKSRWAPQEVNPLQLPELFKDLTGGAEHDPEVQGLHLRLLDINQRLQTGQVLEDRVDGMRSPSPEPIYDNMGIRINTREFRARERLTRERQELIHELMKRNPNFKPPADYRPPKLSKKLYIPVKDYPGYNFIGLIIGPRGNTQKRMQKETGAKIVIRGKGSIKEGRSQQKKDFGVDSGENDDLHVYIEADNENSLQQAVGMVEKLLLPVDELLNEHKKAQLRELAALNGTICENEICRLCGEPGHRHYMCPAKNTTFKSDVSCKICGDGGHPTIDCPMKNSAGPNKMDDEYASFLAEVGGGQQVSGPTGQQTATSGQAVYQNSANGQPTASPVPGSVPIRPGLGSAVVPHPSKEIDETNLYIGYLPPSVDDQGLINLFSPFGKIEASKLIKDRTTGWSKGYGFVKYSDPAEAAQAVIHMNGYRLDGKVLAVRVAGRPPPPVGIVSSIPFQSHSVGFSPQPQSQANQQQPHPSGNSVPANPVSQPPPWSLPHVLPNPYIPPNNYYGPPPPGAVPPYQQSVYTYPGFMGQMPHPSSGFVGAPIQGPPGNVFPPGTGTPTIAPSVNGVPPPPGISSSAPAATGISQEVHQYADYSCVPPPPAADQGIRQVEHNPVESEYERFMSEMQQ